QSGNHWHQIFNDRSSLPRNHKETRHLVANSRPTLDSTRLLARAALKKSLKKDEYIHKTILNNSDSTSYMQEGVEKVQLQFIGCGDAFGSGGRFNTCFHIAGANTNFLIDSGFF
ncbi:MAG: hypothetical protein AMK69_26190, partial [Nitrospira bacterium SG8_3]